MSKYFTLSSHCSKKDAKNRHPKPNSCSSTSGSQPSGPWCPLYQSLLWWKLDLYNSHQYSTIHTTTALQPSCLLQPTYRGGPGVGKPSIHSPPSPPFILLSKQTKNQRQKFKGENQRKGIAKGDGRERHNIPHLCLLSHWVPAFGNYEGRYRGVRLSGGK